MTRVCPNCYREEGGGLRLNFGPNLQAEAEFHKQHWCKCGYSSPEEMMQDQDLGFDDPRWVGIAKYFLNNYYLRLKQGEINNKDEHMRFFLKLLKSAANNYRLSIELINRKNGEEYDFIYNGKSKKHPRINIFDSSSGLKEVPETITFGTVNNDLLNGYRQSQQTMAEFKKMDIKKNRWIAGLILLVIILGIIAIFI
jgi:hypothetical protein